MKIGFLKTLKIDSQILAISFILLNSSSKIKNSSPPDLAIESLPLFATLYLQQHAQVNHL